MFQKVTLKSIKTTNARIFTIKPSILNIFGQYIKVHFNLHFLNI